MFLKNERFFALQSLVSGFTIKKSSFFLSFPFFPILFPCQILSHYFLSSFFGRTFPQHESANVCRHVITRFQYKKFTLSRYNLLLAELWTIQTEFFLYPFRFMVNNIMQMIKEHFLYFNRVHINENLLCTHDFDLLISQIPFFLIFLSST